MDEIEKVKSAITTQQNSSGNSSGMSVLILKQIVGIDFNKLSVILNQLHQEKFIKVRQGINQKLIFLRNYDHNKKQLSPKRSL